MLCPQLLLSVLVLFLSFLLSSLLMYGVILKYPAAHTPTSFSLGVTGRLPSSQRISSQSSVSADLYCIGDSLLDVDIAAKNSKQNTSSPVASFGASPSNQIAGKTLMSSQNTHSQAMASHFSDQHHSAVVLTTVHRMSRPLLHPFKHLHWLAFLDI